MNDDKFVRNVDEVLRKTIDKELQEPPEFGGKPGEPVPAVDPENLKTVWQIGQDTLAGHQGVAIGADLMKQLCKPGADIAAVSYRASLIWMVTQIAPEDMQRFTRDGQPDDAVFRAAAMVPAEWMGVGVVRQGPPLDVTEFLRLCSEK
jgi:hypothetical protein